MLDAIQKYVNDDIHNGAGYSLLLTLKSGRKVEVTCEKFYPSVIFGYVLVRGGDKDPNPPIFIPVDQIETVEVLWA